MPSADEKAHQSYFAEFYAQSHRLLESESAFARFCCPHLPSSCLMADMGCGNGRDAFYFAEHGHHVWGFDFSPIAIAGNVRRQRARSQERVHFHCADINHTPSLLRILRAWDQINSPRTVYARFLLHSITEDCQNRLLTLAHTVLRHNELFFIECRTTNDAKTPKTFGTHFRRYIHPASFIELATTEFSFACILLEQGYGLSVYEQEDPHIARIILARQ